MCFKIILVQGSHNQLSKPIFNIDKTPNSIERMNKIIKK